VGVLERREALLERSIGRFQGAELGGQRAALSELTVARHVKLRAVVADDQLRSLARDEPDLRATLRRALGVRGIPGGGDEGSA
jgi:hypothetical protein